MILQWKPTIADADTLTVSDEFPTMMEEAGYRLPCTLTDEDLPVLRGMAAAADASTRPILKELIRLIIDHDSIDLTHKE